MRRRLDTSFNMSFLDVMFCGFGAVVLLVVLLYGRVIMERNRVHEDLRAQVLAQEREISVTRKRMELRQSTLETTAFSLEAAKAEIAAARKRIAGIERQLEGSVTPAAVEQLIAEREAELQRLERRIEELRKEARQRSGQQVVRFDGEGRRQYLSGLKLGGKRVLILLDASASMLDDTIVNVIRLRNMDSERQKKAEKWQRAVRSTRWLLANLDPDSEFQLYLFNTRARPILEGTAGQWLKASDARIMDRILRQLEEETVPEDGTSLINAFSVVEMMTPRADNILLLTDGLPTQGRTKPRRATVSGEQRLKYFESAMREVGARVPVNTILFPMEGDPVAAAAYWLLAARTRGSFIAPATDWP